MMCICIICLGTGHLPLDGPFAVCQDSKMGGHPLSLEQWALLKDSSKTGSVKRPGMSEVVLQD